MLRSQNSPQDNFDETLSILHKWGSAAREDFFRYVSVSHVLLAVQVSKQLTEIVEHQPVPSLSHLSEEVEGNEKDSRVDVALSSVNLNSMFSISR